MTAVEFYDRTPIENVISSLITVPDKIIFIGDGKVMKKFDKVYRNFIESRKLNIELVYRSVNKNDLNSIVETLSDIVESEDQCIFDLTGGADLELVAMGIVFHKYPEKNIQMQRLNVRNGVVTDCDNDGNILCSNTPEITVEENIRLHGGVIRYENGENHGTFNWDLSEDFINDINKMWDICKKNPGHWNSQLNVLEAFEACVDNPSLNVDISISKADNYLAQNNIKQKCNIVKGLLEILNRQHLINSYKCDGQNISFVYKNEQVKKCLIKAGTILEIKVLIVAKGLKNDDNTDFYTDSMNGVYIDWDGTLHEMTDTEKDTENEIDVILMKGLIPVFISCKNGHVDDDELYKLDAVTNKFGGIYARKILIATYLGKKSMNYFRQRAIDMNITLIENVHELTDEKFSKKIKNLINI